MESLHQISSVASAEVAYKSALAAEVIPTAVLGDEALRRFGLSNLIQLTATETRFGL